MLNDKLVILHVNEMVIQVSSGNENNTHLSITYETESTAEHGLSRKTFTFDMLWTTSYQIYLHVKRFKKQI